jgi:hypothetical protein
VTVTVTNTAGESGSATADHAVVFAFAGFLPPIDGTAPNTAKAGSAVPVRFSLGGDHGLAILAAGSPTSRPVACATGVAAGPADATLSAGASSLTDDPVTGTYHYVWKTRKAWAGTCRRLTVTLVDGSSHSALFAFSR